VKPRHRQTTDGRDANGPGASAARYAVPALLAACVIAAFLPVFGGTFLTWDDPGYVYQNPMVSGGLSARFVGWAFTSFQESNWHPLTWLSHALDVTLFGLNAPAHHAVNLLLHLLSTLVLYRVFLRMTGDRWKSAFVALVFGIHPLHVESVAWISERKDVLSGLFMMLTLDAYAAWAAEGRRADYLRALGCFAAGLLAKPMLVTIPFVLLLLDYWPLGRMQGAVPAVASAGRRAVTWRGLLIEKAPFLLLAAASSTITYIAQQAGGAISALGPLPLSDRAANAAVSYLGYLSKAVYPVDLAFFYPHRLSAIGRGEIVLSLAIVAVVSLGAWKLRARFPWFVTGWLVFLGMLVPVIGLVQVGLQAMADRYMYLPVIGLAVIAAWGIPAALAGRPVARPLLRGAFAAATIAMGVLTWNQAVVWGTSDRLYAHALAVTEGNHIAHTNIGVTLMEEGRNAEAIPHLREALRLWPRNDKNFSNYGRALAAVGRYTEALPYYKDLLKNLEPNPLLHLRTGDVYAGLRMPDSALAHYRTAVALDPTMLDAWVAIADVASARSDFDGARAAVAKAFAAWPGNSHAHDMLGIVAGRQGRMEEAEAEFRRAIASDSTNDAAYVDLGILYEKTGRMEMSKGMYQAAVRVSPRSVNARVRLGVAMAREGDTAGAEREWRRCVEIEPPAVEARMNLAKLYTMRGEAGKAVEEYNAVIAADPRRAEAHYLSGSLLASKGDVEGAKRRYREALRAEPGFSEAAEALRRLESGGK
jgi:tetratricopeptide (TPR) repeat protein